MNCAADLVYSPDLRAYNHGPGHPMRPDRFVLTRELIAAYGLLEREGVRELAPRIATNDELALVHDHDYIEATIAASEGAPGNWSQYGFGPGDNPIFLDMHTAAARVAGATLVAADSVLNGPGHAFSPAGGLHHAMPDRASGFCVYDDPAIAIAWLLNQRGVERIAYIDIDVHHGDGVQAIFYDDPRVLTISIHESGRSLFPGTGGINELGGPEAEGTSVNIPLPPGTGGKEWLNAFAAVVPPLLKEWKADVLVTQLGCDTHATDPLAHLLLNTPTYARVTRMLHMLAHQEANGRWLATGGGGYQWSNVVPRAWTIAFAQMVGADLPDEIPETFLAEAERVAGTRPPATLSEPEEASAEGVPALVSATVTAVRERVFPMHGAFF